MEDLRQKVVLVTGAARGRGKLHAENFCREGAVVVMTDVDQDGVEQAAGELRSAGFEAYPYVLDVSDRDACFELVDRVRSEVGPIEVLVNNAGITECYAMLDLAEESLRRMMNVNYFGEVWMMQAVVPDMLKRGAGHVVNMCSVMGKAGAAYMGGYCATKHAVVGMTDAVRQELRGSGVNFTIINPGFVATGMFEGATVPFITSWMDPQRVSRAVVDAVKKNRWEVCVPRFVVRLIAFTRGLCLPKLMDFSFHLLKADKSMTAWKKDDRRPF
jgi:short-subunit dehydrogenase